MSLRVVLGVTGSIAAYKAVDLARLLQKQGASVQAMLTRGAVRFVTPLTFEAVSGRPVRTSVWSLSGSETRQIDHVEDAYSADLVVVAPASASFIARYAHGWADDALTATLLSTRAPVYVCPAMETNMWQHPSTQANVELLRSRGVEILGPEAGDLASGRTGEGRMWAPERIADLVFNEAGRAASVSDVSSSGDLQGLKILLTAGPTWEPIDPVRFLTNRSTGTMGIALADAAARRGAEVRLVLGPTHLKPAGSVAVRRVETAAQMLATTQAWMEDIDVLIASAAVSDYRPSSPRAGKLKRSDPDAAVLRLLENPDILSTLAAELRRGPRPPTIVGFAAETDDVVKHAGAKLSRKGCDMVIGNFVGPEAGFGGGRTEVVAVFRQGEPVRFGPADKPEVAEFVLDQVLEQRRQQAGS